MKARFHVPERAQQGCQYKIFMCGAQLAALQEQEHTFTCLSHLQQLNATAGLTGLTFENETGEKGRNGSGSPA